MKDQKQEQDHKQEQDQKQEQEQDKDQKQEQDQKNHLARVASSPGGLATSTSPPAPAPQNLKTPAHNFSTCSPNPTLIHVDCLLLDLDDI